MLSTTRYQLKSCVKIQKQQGKVPPSSYVLWLEAQHSIKNLPPDRYVDLMKLPTHKMIDCWYLVQIQTGPCLPICMFGRKCKYKFGKFHLAYELFTKENEKILSGECSMDLVGNTAKKNRGLFAYDVETVVVY